MIDKKIRVGAITSSRAGELLNKTGGAAYKKQLRRERQLGRCMNNDAFAYPLEWGKLLEPKFFEILPITCTLNSSETLQHPKYNFWLGTPDGFEYNGKQKERVFDIKCPWTLDSYMNAYECETIDDLIKAHKSGRDYIWQVISNAAISGVRKGELIFFVPTEDQLDKMLQDDNMPTWVLNKGKEGLPYIPSTSKIKNTKSFKFDISEDEIKLLENAIINANKEIEELC